MEKIERESLKVKRDELCIIMVIYVWIKTIINKEEICNQFHSNTMTPTQTPTIKLK